MSDSVTSDHGYTDTHYHYENVRVQSFEEERNREGELRRVKVVVRADLVEPVPDGELIHVDDKKFQLNASAISTDGETVRITKFHPLRDEDDFGLYVHEFEVLWPTLAELYERGYDVDTGAIEVPEEVTA